MKSVAAWILVLWFALVVETARPDLFPSASLLLPCAVGCLFWLNSVTGMVLTGAALLLNWVLHPTLAPAEVPAVLTTFCLAFSAQHKRLATVGHRTAMSAWLHPLLVLVAGVLARTLAAGNSHLNQLLTDVSGALMVATPVLAAILLTQRFAEELGFRRLSNGWR